MNTRSTEWYQLCQIWWTTIRVRWLGQISNMLLIKLRRSSETLIRKVCISIKTTQIFHSITRAVTIQIARQEFIYTLAALTTTWIATWCLTNRLHLSWLHSWVRQRCRGARWLSVTQHSMKVASMVLHLCSLQAGGVNSISLFKKKTKVNSWHLKAMAHILNLPSQR